MMVTVHGMHGLPFVNQDDALKEYKGKIIDRNAGRQPWRNRLDFE